MKAEHRTVVHRERGFWWWRCVHCTEHLGYGRRWARVFAAAERHAITWGR